MGARGAGHIAGLCDIARPTIGVVTAVELVHAELFGDLDDIARAKGELPASLPRRRRGRAQRRRRAGGGHGRAHRGPVDPLRRRPRRRAGRRTSSSTPTCGPGSGSSRRGAPPTCTSACAASTTSTTRWPPPPSPCCATCPIDEVAAGLEVERAVAVADGAAHRAERRPRAQRRLQRRPGLDGGGAAGAGPPRRRPPPSRCSGPWPSWATRARPSTGASPRWPTSSGSTSSPSAPTTTAWPPCPTPTRRSTCWATLGPDDAVLVKGSRVAGPRGRGRAPAQPLTGAGPVAGRGRAGRRHPATTPAAALLGWAQVGVPGQEHGERGADQHHRGDRGEARRTGPPPGRRWARCRRSSSPTPRWPGPGPSRRGAPGTRWPAR